MTLTEKITDIASIINDNGGVNFLKIRFFLEDIDRLAASGHQNAIEFSRQLDNVHRALQHAVSLEFTK
jgi:hypothetical protein